MANAYFRFKQFTVHQDHCAMKVTTDGCLFGAWCAAEISRLVQPRSAAPPPAALDIGTGTGLLSLMVAQKAPLPIDAVEIDRAAAAQAVENVTTSPYSNQIRIMETDVLQLKNKSYWVIFSNPPFYENELTSGNAAKDTAHHSQQLTWEQLFAALNSLLGPNGVFFLLLPFKRAGEVERYLQKEGFFINKMARVHQSTRHAPFRIMIQGSREASPHEVEELFIRDEYQQYTPGFTALLKDYYLYL